jgi:hypothetical protein
MEVDNILVRYNDMVITEYDLENCINRYLSTLINPDDIYKNHRLFNGMLLYLYKHLIVYILPDTYNNDYDLLDGIFMNIYIPLCYIYNHIPSISNFSILTRLQYSYIYDLHTGTYKDGSIVNNKSKQIVKKWIDICDGELLENIMHTNSVGSMFVAKVHGFREDNIASVNITVNQPVITETQLNSIALTGMPELPDTEN